MTTTREQLLAEDAKLQARIKKRTEDNRRDEKRRYQIEADLHRLAIVALVGIPNGVRRKYRVSKSDRLSILNDATGTVTKARRTRATVDFGEHGDGWDCLIENLLPTERDQGFNDITALTETFNG